MLSLLLVASFVLPSVLGNCCLPDTISATVIDAGSSNYNDVLVDFKQQKFIFRPADTTIIDFILYNVADNKVFTMFHSGLCSYHALPLDPGTYDQCFHDAKMVGSSYLGPNGGMLIDSYMIKHTNDQSIMGVTHDKCVPVVSFSKIGDDMTTRFWVNVTTSVTDLTPLDVDVVNCIKDDTWM